MARDDPSGDTAPDRTRYRQSSFVPRESSANSSRPATRRDWERLPADPDLDRDLGYRIANWEAFCANDEDDNVLFLPDDEELLKTDAFLVADANSVCYVSDRV